ncbi:hypothetical protein [Phenylobacterium sp.]|uniref:hypothetical protein n=1 Tax=Phenylobacterium sp. TaxID=1871053 RepID=UPI0027256DDF|nr:hypothetical protein [Phenylobacterium sp.]MDO8800447.1 hypothetical protein [Phenylobacterium sp.]
MSGEPTVETDGQDQAEALDETILDDREQVGEMRTFEELPQVLDVTHEPEDDVDDALGADNDDEPGPDDVEGPFIVHTGESDADLDKRIDEGLKESFPASDPLSVTRRED